MSKFLTVLTLTAISLAPITAMSKPMPLSMIGVGPHGYDFSIGNWSCRNTVPTRVSGASTGRFTSSRSVNGAIINRVTSASYDTTYYAIYSSKTKTWLSPQAYANGSYEFESTQQTGAKVLWTGTLFDAASGQTHPIRDTITYTNPTTSIDVTQVKVGGTWRTQGNTTCTKS